MGYLWKKYKSIVFAHCTAPHVPTVSVQFWKNRYFANTVLYLIPLSPIVILLGIYGADQQNIVGLIISFAITAIAILTVAFTPRLSVFVRKLIFNGALYFISFMHLYYLGSDGPGLLYLLGVLIFVLISLDRRFGAVAFGINTLICLYFGVAISYGFASHVVMNTYNLNDWIRVSSELIFLSGISVLLIPRLFEGLRTASEQLEQTNRELEAKNEELEQFTHTISHDLKQPLWVICHFIKLLQNNHGNQLDNEAHEYIDNVLEEAQQMRGNIDDLLEYSRVGRKQSTVKKTDLNQLVDEAIHDLHAEIENNEARVQVSDLPTLSIVPVAVKTVFQNLISNGIKYQPEENQPVIKIEAEELEDLWQFSVIDNGIGIDPQYKDEIFAIFNRLHTREEYSGNGMGLALCQKIIEQHGGRIWVESTPGKGSKFFFTIPKNH